MGRLKAKANIADLIPDEDLASDPMKQQAAIMAQLRSEGLGEIPEGTRPEFSSRWRRSVDDIFTRQQGRVRPNVAPGRRARYDYERQPSRPAYKRPKLGGKRFGAEVFEGVLPGVNPDPVGVIRGGKGDIHMTVHARYEPSLKEFVTGKDPYVPRMTALGLDEKGRKFWQAYEQLPESLLDDWEETAGFIGRGGEFMSRQEHEITRGHEESFNAADMERRIGAKEMTTIGRAGSLEEADQVKRRTMAGRVRDALANMRENRTYLERINRHVRDPEVTAQIQKLTRGIGKLHNIAITRGLKGLGWWSNMADIGSQIENAKSVEGKYGDRPFSERLLRFTEKQLGVPGVLTGTEEGGST